MKLIDKNKLLEGLKKLKQNLSASPIVVIEDVESLVESLEITEVDLEKEIGMFTTQTMLKKRNHSTGVFHLTQADVNNIAKHFFELGLKSKGE